MYITQVLSHNGGWERIQNEHLEAWQDLVRVITDLKAEDYPAQFGQSSPGHRALPALSIRDFDHAFSKSIGAKKWSPLILPMSESLHKRVLSVDGVRDGLCVELAFGKYWVVESSLFVKYPLLVDAGLIKIAIVLMPTSNLVEQLHLGAASRIETVRDRLRALASLPLKYPFAILGISSDESSCDVEEMTSQLNKYLMKHVGQSLVEMALDKEKTRYDFKEVLPPDSQKIAKLACAFANYPGGGWMLVGIDDDGREVGILRSNLDDIQLRITNIVKDSCHPRPVCDLEVIEMPGDASRCFLIVYVRELERKPCLVDHRVYVRRGTESVAADSEEIRRLIVRET